MSKYAIINGRIYTEEETIERGYIIVNNDKIHTIEVGDYNGNLKTFDAHGENILPGFIDIHIHGGYGEDVMDGSYKGLKHLSEQLLSEGTTAFLATTMTQSDSNIEKALKNVSEYKEKQQKDQSAEIIGIHLEGPFISEYKVGAQNPKYVQRPSVDKINHFQKLSNKQIKIITFAPEVENALPTLDMLHDNIIFSIGHTAADFEQVNKATKHGARHITHLYNAGTSFHHREPGVFGAAWTNENLKTELIVDGVHSHPTSVKIAYKMKGKEHFYLITDAMRAKGKSDGEYDLGGQSVIVKGKEARLKTGSLAGSILKMNEGLQNLIYFTEDTLDNLWRVASLNQAKSLGIDEYKGSIKVGKEADIVIVDDEINVKVTIKSGKIHTY